MTARRPVVFDLTELMIAARGKGWYGAARWVFETGRHLAAIDRDVRFCVFSSGHDAFIEVPVTDGPDGLPAFDLPPPVRERRLRSVFHGRQPVQRAAAGLVRPLVAARNRRRWTEAGASATPLSLDGCAFVTGTRPKVAVEAIAAIRRGGANVEIVPMIYDLVPMHFSIDRKGRPFRTNYVDDAALMIREAARILTISDFSRDEILSMPAHGYLDAPPAAPIHPVPLVHECPPGDGPPGTPPPDGPFILTVGALLGRKNLDVVLATLAVLRDRGGPVPRLVIAGIRPPGLDDHLTRAGLDGIRDLLIFRPSPPQADLVALYEAAVATIMPSRMEGWGLPAGESLWLGTPAICSTAPALREVAGDLGLYFDPDDAGALADHVARLMDDAAFADALRSRIRAARPGLRTWADVARDVAAVI